MTRPNTSRAIRLGSEDDLTIERLARLTGETPLRDRREDDVRRAILALSRVVYEQGRQDALDELAELIS